MTCRTAFVLALGGFSLLAACGDDSRATPGVDAGSLPTGATLNLRLSDDGHGGWVFVDDDPIAV